MSEHVYPVYVFRQMSDNPKSFIGKGLVFDFPRTPVQLNNLDLTQERKNVMPAKILKFGRRAYNKQLVFKNHKTCQAFGRKSLVQSYFILLQPNGYFNTCYSSISSDNPSKTKIFSTVVYHAWFAKCTDIHSSFGGNRWSTNIKIGHIS